MVCHGGPGARNVPHGGCVATMDSQDGGGVRIFHHDVRGARMDSHGGVCARNDRYVGGWR